MRKWDIKFYRYFIYTFLAVDILIGSVGYNLGNFNLFLCGLMLVWCANMAACLKNFRLNFVFFLFQVSIFTFLLSRPFIGFFRGERWWETANQSPEGMWFALFVIMLSEIALFIGKELAQYSDVLLSRIWWKKEKKRNISFRENLQCVSLVVFFIFLIFFIIEQVEPLLTIGVGNYLEYYSGFESELPGFVHTFASFMKYSLAIFLSTLPDKRKAFIPLVLYVLSMVPSLLIGVRNPFILSVLFCLCYYVIRDYLGDTKKWIGKVEKRLLCVGIPAGIIFMGAYAYIRVGLTNIASANPLKMIMEFFYGQGTSFNVLAIGYGYREGLRILKPVNYTFGGIIDYIYRGTVGQAIFGTQALTSYNSEFNATHSNALSHALSNLYLKEEYINGRGVGSSYLLENYIDYGYIGVFLFSVVLGILLIYMIKGFGNKMLWNTIILISLMNILFVPRAEATSWLTFIVTLQFWFCIAVCYGMAFVCSKIQLVEKISNKIQRKKES